VTVGDATGAEPVPSPPARMGDGNFYRFRSEWCLDAPPRATYSVLEQVVGYAAWWPEVRRARLVEVDSCEVVCRSLLPYQLSMVLRPSRVDPESGVLEAAIDGDLEGFARWTVGSRPSGSHLVFEEEVTVTKRSLRWLAPLARPAFRANHAAMMRHGRSGLTAHLRRLPDARSMAGASI
jgi:hypothetical protein